jgi:predicted PurR-regulated permease PerM
MGAPYGGGVGATGIPAGLRQCARRLAGESIGEAPVTPVPDRRPAILPVPPATRPTSEPPWLTRERALVLVLVLLTLAIGALCALVVAPFVPTLTWAVTLAVIGHPVQRFIAARIGNPAGAAALATVAVTLGIAVPMLVVGGLVAREAVDAADTVRELVAERRWEAVIARSPTLQAAVQYAQEHIKDGDLPQQIGQAVAGRAQGVVTGFAYALVGALVTVFFLFYFLRDRRLWLSAIPQFLPLSPTETEEVIAKVHDTIQAMVVGTLIVSLVQGTLGGLMFWWLGLPSPLVWGTVMAILSVLPMFGAALVWAPVAVYLALTGEVGHAIILATWGAIVVGLVDNVLKPMLVRGRMQLHTVPVFIAVLGGLAVFGGTGIVLGPLVLALAVGLLDIWRRRFAVHHAAEDGIDPPAPRRVRH